MSLALLDINDINLQLWHGEAQVQSPAYALLDGNDYRFGGPARAASRLRPRDVSTRFWWQLGTEPLQPALGPARHSADLVHAHLLAMHREAGSPDAVLLAVPGSMERDQLALLLGIIEQCPFRAAGLVNRSLALACSSREQAPQYHLEFQLHQAVLSELEDSEGQRRVVHSQALAGCGLLHIQERLVDIIARAFIRQTRFDPRRKADSEQDLYNALPETLRNLRKRDESEISLRGYRASLHRSDLEAAGQRLFESLQLNPGDQAKLLVDPVGALLPGLEERFRHLHLLGPQALPESLPLLEQYALSEGEALTLVQSLPLTHSQRSADTQSFDGPTPEVDQPDAPISEDSELATHLLQGFRAKALNPAGTDLGAGWQIYREAQAWRLRAQGFTGEISVNGQPASPGRVIHCGDTLVVENSATTFVIQVAKTVPEH